MFSQPGITRIFEDPVWQPSCLSIIVSPEERLPFSPNSSPTIWYFCMLCSDNNAYESSVYKSRLFWNELRQQYNLASHTGEIYPGWLEIRAFEENRNNKRNLQFPTKMWGNGGRPPNCRHHPFRCNNIVGSLRENRALMNDGDSHGRVPRNTK